MSCDASKYLDLISERWKKTQNEELEIYGPFLASLWLQWAEHVTEIRYYKTMVKTLLGSNCVEDLNRLEG
jgi:hypothetical protein